MSEEKSLPKPLTDLPLPEKDLPLPEKELPARASEPNSKTTTLNNDKPKASFIFKSFLLGILFVFLIILIGGGAFMLGKNTKSENQQVTETQVSAPSPTPAWNTYTGDGFSFNYPSDMKQYPSSKRNEFPSIDSIMVGKPDSDASITFETFANNSSQSASEWWSKNATPLLNSQANMNSNGVANKIGDFELSTISYGSNEFLYAKSKNGIGTQYFITNGKIIVNIFPGLLNEKDKEQILSMFKFTDITSSTDTSNWKTYLGDGFSFKYPQEMTLDDQSTEKQLIIDLEDSNTEIRFDSMVLDTPPNTFASRLDPVESFIMNGNKWIVYPESSYCDAGMCGKTRKTFELVKNTKNYTFLATKIDDNLMKLILSTFKFEN